MSNLLFNKADLTGYSLVSNLLQDNAARPPQTATILEGNGTALVPLEAHIMSKCPDAKVCLRDLVVPVMEKVANMVDFNLSFIGQ